MATVVKKELPPKVFLLECGSFNPVHYLHLRMIEQARDYCQELGSEVVGGCLSPANDLYVKPGLLPSKQRVEMCKLAVQHSDWYCDDWEASQSVYPHTLEVMRHFRKVLSEKNGTDVVPLLVCGADLLDSFNRPGCWPADHMEEILSQYGILCLERPGTDTNRFNTSPVLGPHINHVHIMLATATNDLSSTAIRACINKGHSLKYLVPDAVIKYISDNKLYLNK